LNKKEKNKHKIKRNQKEKEKIKQKGRKQTGNKKIKNNRQPVCWTQAHTCACTP
jgi:hypothetical protein